MVCLLLLRVLAVLKKVEPPAVDVPSECVCELCAIKKSHTYVVVRLP